MNSAAVLPNNPEAIPDKPLAQMDLLNQNPRDLQESQLEFVTSALDHEITEHNSTRIQRQRYLGLYLKNERGLCGERAYAQYLDSIIKELRKEVQKEKTQRIESEEARALLLRQNLEEYCCEYDPENAFGEREVVEDQTVNSPSNSGRNELVCPSAATTSMLDLTPIIQWCDNSDYPSQRPESARQATPNMEKVMWEQTSGVCKKRQRGDEDESLQGSSKICRAQETYPW